MLKVGITGQTGFVGTHLFNYFRLKNEEFELVPFEDEFFRNNDILRKWVSQCDVIVHLAAMNRHNDNQVLYDTNLKLVKQLVEALEATQSHPHVLFSSSTQEERDNIYGKSKKEGRQLFCNWAKKSGATFTGLIIPNVFGPFGNPYYNSVIATFSHQLTHGELPIIEVDGQLKLIYVGELVEEIHKIITSGLNQEECRISNTSEQKVSEILAILERFKVDYFNQGIFPELKNRFEVNLFNTFRCYIDIKNNYPVKLKMNTDDRGSFVETIKMGLGGQVSFSTTKPGITRGNHFHTRKIERFAVIKGEARIQLRKIGTNEKFAFYLSGKEPAYVDMPIWYTHNITNIGQEELYTIFWINEFLNPADPDTFFEEV